MAFYHHRSVSCCLEGCIPNPCDIDYTCAQCYVFLFKKTSMQVMREDFFDTARFLYLKPDVLPTWIVHQIGKLACREGELLCPDCGSSVGEYTHSVFFPFSIGWGSNFEVRVNSKMVTSLGGTSGRSNFKGLKNRDANGSGVTPINRKKASSPCGFASKPGNKPKHMAHQRTISEFCRAENHENWLCPVCLELLSQPQRVLPCDHVYCESCLMELAHAAPLSTPCPLCRTVIEKCVADAALEEQIRLGVPSNYRVKLNSPGPSKDLSQPFQGLLPGLQIERNLTVGEWLGHALRGRAHVRGGGAGGQSTRVLWHFYTFVLIVTLVIVSVWATYFSLRFFGAVRDWVAHALTSGMLSNEDGSGASVAMVLFGCSVIILMLMLGQ